MFRSHLVLLLLASGLAAGQQAQAQASDISSPQLLTLEEVVKQVQAANPAIASSQKLLEAQRRRVVQAGALPDPTITVSYMGDPVPFKTQDMDPSSYRGFSAMQMFPLGGKRELRRTMARAEVSAADADRVAVVRRLTADAKSAFYDYFYYTKALDITARNKARLEQLADISEARYRVGKAMQSDVLRAHLEVAMLLQKQIALQQQRDVAVARLNTIMGRAPESPLPPAAEIAKEALPPIASLTPAAQAGDPMLQKELSMIERNKIAVAMAKKEYVPDLSVGYMYQQRPGMPDMHGLQFSVNLPIFYKSKQREGVQQAKLELESAEKSQEARKLELTYELQQMYAMAVNAAKMMDLYDQAIMPQADLALQSAQSSYTVGNVDFLTVVTNFTSIHGYQLDYYRQLADFETALARIEALTGDLSQASKEAKQ